MLRDGWVCHIRPILPTDRESLAAFHRALSEETVYYRFFAPYPELTDRDLDRFTQVDHIDRVALVALLDDRIIGVGRYDRLQDADAEVAFVVSDSHQGRGLGSILLEHLAAAARERGIRRFEAEVLPSNRRMLATFEEAGYRPTEMMEGGVVRLHFDNAPSEASRAVMQAREQRSEARSIAGLLAPRSVMVIGVGRHEDSVGNALLHNLVRAGFTGELAAVHPGATEIHGVRCYPGVAEVPGPVDLAVVAVPAEQVLSVIEQCGHSGVRGAVVVSAGFAETGPVGRELQGDVVAAARGHGMRLIGPNALGIINTDPAVALNASLVDEVLPRGSIGFFAQSGALGASLLVSARQRGMSVSTFVSAGNRADVSANDLLQYWEDDEATSLVLLYLESIGNPRKFARVARRLGVRKPIVAVRSGRSSQSLPLGHSMRRTGLPPEALDAMFDQAGIIQVSNLPEMFDVATLLTFQPLPRGRRVAVISNSNALAVLAADACESSGLDVMGDPAALGVVTGTEELADAVRSAIDDDGIDAVIALFVPVMRSLNPGIRHGLGSLAGESTKPLVSVQLAVTSTSRVIEVPGRHGLPGPGSIPVFYEVEAAVQALAHVMRYATWLDTPRGVVPELANVATERAHQVVGRIREQSEHQHGAEALVPMSADDLTELLGCYGITLWASVPVSTETEAVAAAQTLGYPVVLKTGHPGLVHRPDLGGVRTALENELAVRTAYLSLMETLPADAHRRLVVQSQAPAGVACLIEKREDALFGPVVAFGVGGEVSRLLGDRGYRSPPLTDRDVDDLIKAPRAAPLLFGYRGSPQADVAALAGLIHRVGRLADDLPEVMRLELNPVIISSHGTAVVGAAGWTGPTVVRADLEARRLLG